MRPAGPADAPVLEALFVDKRRREVEAWGFTDQQLLAFLRSQYAAFRQSLVGNSALREWVLSFGDTDCGYLAVAERDGALVVVELQVLTTQRRQGVARRALEVVLAEADTRQLDVQLRVDHGNPARVLYESLGFVVNDTDDLGVFMRRSPAR